MRVGGQTGPAPTLGVGVDYRLSDRWSLRGEYLYASAFKKKSVPLDNCVCSQALYAQSLRFGLAYHFE